MIDKLDRSSLYTNRKTEPAEQDKTATSIKSRYEGQMFEAEKEQPLERPLVKKTVDLTKKVQAEKEKVW